jgi:virginiamycin B lyase
MRVVRLATLAGALVLVPAVAAGAAGVERDRPDVATAPAAPQLTGDALLRALRRGGYVVYFRHAATDFSMSDTDTGNLANCARQRNLDARGKADARAIGRAWRALRLPIARVLSSRYCRARDTARLAFGRARMTLDLTGLPSAATDAERQRRIQALRGLLSARPARGNTVLVAHLFNIQEAADVSLEEGEAAVFEPRGRGRFRLVGRVLPRAWLGLAPLGAEALAVREYDVPAGTHPHDVAPAPGGTVWYTAQASGALGNLDPRTGRTRHIPLGAGSAPHGVIVGPDGAPWITDGGLNAIVRVDPKTDAVRRFRLPASASGANLNTATFDKRGILWFTGQSGFYGRLNPRTGSMRVWRAPRGFGPYGIATTPAGAVYYASLAGSYLGRIDIRTGKVTVLQPPTRNQGARRAWSDSRGRIWISEWNAGKVGRYDPATKRWREWRLPGRSPQPYAVYVDERDMVWLTDFGANALVRFDPRTSRFTTVRLASADAAVRQLLGRRGEIWGAESGVDKLVVVRTTAG